MLRGTIKDMNHGRWIGGVKNWGIASLIFFKLTFLSWFRRPLFVCIMCVGNMFLLNNCVSKSAIMFESGMRVDIILSEIELVQCVHLSSNSCAFVINGNVILYVYEYTCGYIWAQMHVQMYGLCMCLYGIACARVNMENILCVCFCWYEIPWTFIWMCMYACGII